MSVGKISQGVLELTSKVRWAPETEERGQELQNYTESIKGIYGQKQERRSMYPKKGWGLLYIAKWHMLT